MTRSIKFRLSSYDWLSTVRDVIAFIIAALVANIGAFEVWVNGLGINTFFATLIIWSIIELGRKFGKDYTSK